MFKLKFQSLKTPSQSGVNIVDLMMWLVVASLMSSTSIQSTGYYRQAVQNNTLKNDAQIVRSYMEAEYAANLQYPNASKLENAITSGDVKLSSRNVLTGVYHVPGVADWAVRICSLDLKDSTGNAAGTAVRITKADPNKYDFRVCSSLDEPGAVY